MGDKDVYKLWGTRSEEFWKERCREALGEEYQALLSVVRAAEKIYETTEDGYMFKHILVEGEGDKWHIPEIMGLALAEALKALPEHLRGEG